MSDNDKNVKTAPATLNSYEAAIDPKQIVKSSSPVDGLFWLVAVVLLIGSTLVNRYLPEYWAQGQALWVRAIVIVLMLLVAIGLIYLTQQGKGFLLLLKDARRELSLITWATKDDTLKTTWVVLLIVVVVGLILALFDWLSSLVMKLFVG